ncbi:MAG: hypothetical protein ACRDRK_07655 [Pseudonocardia sp.]
MYDIFQAAGGQVRLEPEPSATIAAYLNLDHRVFVNCTGQWAGDFLNGEAALQIDDRPAETNFEPLFDNHKPKYLRGHYLQVDIKRQFADSSGKFFSYNYTPTPDVYGTPQDRHAMSIATPAVTRGFLAEVGNSTRDPLDSGGDWPGEQTSVPEEVFVDADGRAVRVPGPILSLNADLLTEMTGGELDLLRLRREQPDRFRAGIGLRFQRGGLGSGVRLACSRVFNRAEKFVFHNYGHGGSGFALSWGCGLDILERLNGLTGGSLIENSEPAKLRFSGGLESTILILRDLTHRLLVSGMTT